MEYKYIPSVCSYCGVGCGVLFEVLDGELIGTWPQKTNQVNQGKLCIKGWNLHEFITSPMRLKSPLIKVEGRFRRTGWPEAVSLAAEGLKKVVREHGPDSVGLLVSAKMTNEENYVAQKFARAVIGTNNVDHCARL